MRLTLRTMLAYLDGILEPEDAQDIGKKIEESTFASDLIHRIRDLSRRPSVAAPDSASPGQGLGPNAMAEYLDNTLPPEKVTEFEKICLDSDVHLAEVSACHQILTLVLGEPAEIEPASRQRMYDIRAQFDRSMADDAIPSDSQTEIVVPPPLAGLSTSSTDPEAERKARSKPTIPEYLREPTNKYRWVSIATASIVAVCLLVILLKALGSFEPGTTMGNMLVGLGIVKDNKQVAVETEKAAAQPIKTASDASAKAKPENKAKGPEPKSSLESTAKALAAASKAAETAKPSGAEPTSAEPSPGSAEKASTPEKTTEQSEPATETGAKGSGLESGTGGQSGPVLKTEVVQSQDTASKESAETPKQPRGDELAENTAIPSGAKSPEEKASPPNSDRLGRYVSEDQILLGNSGLDTDWQRVASKELLSGGEQLLALPTYRPDINLAAGIKLRVLGGTELELLPAIAKEPAGIKIRFGRIVATPLANSDTRLRIITGDRSGVITFNAGKETDPDTVVAIEVRNIHVPGANPETEPAHITVEFLVTAGRVLWDEKGQKTLEIAAPARLKIEGQSAPELATLKDVPKWAGSSEAISQLDQLAAPVIAKELLAAKNDRTVLLVLKELAEDRRKEVRLLAMRCLAYLNYFDPLVILLNNSEYKNDWDNCVDQLREAVGRDAETAAAVRKALGNRYPHDAADMYRMLWGYNNKNLESGEDEKLVNFLADDNLALRVLSFWNLKDITGKSLLYQPEQTQQSRRQQSVQIWRQRLKANEIRFKTAEE